MPELKCELCGKTDETINEDYEGIINCVGICEGCFDKLLGSGKLDPKDE